MGLFIEGGEMSMIDNSEVDLKEFLKVIEKEANIKDGPKEVKKAFDRLMEVEGGWVNLG